MPYNHLKIQTQKRNKHLQLAVLRNLSVGAIGSDELRTKSAGALHIKMLGYFEIKDAKLPRIIKIFWARKTYPLFAGRRVARYRSQWDSLAKRIRLKTCFRHGQALKKIPRQSTVSSDSLASTFTQRHAHSDQNILCPPLRRCATGST